MKYTLALPKIEERSLYPPLVALLKRIGFDAHGESKVTTTHPDILFKLGDISFVVEVKIGKQEIGLKAVAQASDYAKELGTNNIVILIYPEKYRNQVLLDSDFLDQIALNRKINAGIYTSFWTEAVEDTTENIFKVLKEKIHAKSVTVDFKTVVNQIEYYITDLSMIVYQVSTDELASEVVNKLDLFSSIGEIKDKEIAKKQIINLASYLLLNQILFYHIFRERTKRNIPELKEVSAVKDLQKYFDEITNIDYQSIYRVNILGHIPESRFVLDMLNEVIKAIKILRVEQITDDLTGRFFHDLIPFEIRKVLAAFYTHPVSAALLAGLSVDSWDTTILDPACGSGTLLVSAYKQKMRLYQKLHGYEKLKQIHKKFLENDITGIDIMPFAAHLTTLNLASQDIEQETDIVRIASMDSLSLASVLRTKDFKEDGYKILTYMRQIQSVIDQSQDPEFLRGTGSISLKGDSQGFTLNPVEVVLMNPPFSDREKMPVSMRNSLRNNKTLTGICGNRVNLWGFFLAFADLILKQGGRISAVLPINIGRGEASQEIRQYILDNYRIKYIVKAVKDVAFSEGAQFRDILLIADKVKPKSGDITAIVFLKKSLRKMTSTDSTLIVDKIRNTVFERGVARSDDFDIYFIDHSELIGYRENLMPVLGATDVNTIPVLTHFQDLIKTRGGLKLTSLNSYDIKEGFHASPSGLSQLTFVTRALDEERIKRAFLILKKEDDRTIEVEVKGSDLTYKLKRENLLPALRTLTNADSFYVGKNSDYFVQEEFDGFDSLLGFSKWKDKKSFDWIYVQKGVANKGTYLALARRFRPNSKSTHFFAFFSEKKFITPHTFKIVKTNVEDARIQSLFLNSVVGIMNVVLLREQTTEGFTDIMESDLDSFTVFNPKMLSKEDKVSLTNLFNDLKETRFPSILEQMEKRCFARLKLDETILGVLGMTKKEIDEWLPRVYSTLIEELKSV